MLTFVTLLSSKSLAQAPLQSDPNQWVPDPALVARIDAEALRYELPKEFGSLSAYARYYWGTAHKGRKVVQGALVTPQIRKDDAGQVRIVDEDHAPAFADGGCMFIYLEYDLEAGKITHIECNFDLRPPPRPSPSN
jgi:hypothetical protein